MCTSRITYEQRGFYCSRPGEHVRGMLSSCSASVQCVTRAGAGEGDGDGVAGERVGGEGGCDGGDEVVVVGAGERGGDGGDVCFQFMLQTLLTLSPKSGHENIDIG